MGKSWKNRRHARTGYPYSHMRIAHVHIVQPRVHAENGSYFVGEQLRPFGWSCSVETGLPYNADTKRTSTCKLRTGLPACCEQ